VWIESDDAVGPVNSESPRPKNVTAQNSIQFHKCGSFGWPGHQVIGIRIRVKRGRDSLTRTTTTPAITLKKESVRDECTVIGIRARVKEKG